MLHSPGEDEEHPGEDEPAEPMGVRKEGEPGYDDGGKEGHDEAHWAERSCLGEVTGTGDHEVEAQVFHLASFLGDLQRCLHLVRGGSP